MRNSIRWHNFFLIQKAKGGYLEGVIQLPQHVGDQKIIISTMSPHSEGKSETEQFHPDMIHLLRKKEDGKDRIPSKEPVPNINHWQLELRLKSEGGLFNLCSCFPQYLRGETRDEKCGLTGLINHPVN